MDDRKVQMKKEYGLDEENEINMWQKYRKNR